MFASVAASYSIINRLVIDRTLLLANSHWNDLEHVLWKAVYLDSGVGEGCVSRLISVYFGVFAMNIPIHAIHPWPENQFPHSAS